MRLAPGRKKHCLIALALMPGALWVLAARLAPLDGVRSRMAAVLAEQLGQPVRIDALELGLLGEVSAGGLAVGDPGRPWLRCGRVRLDLDAMALLGGRVRPNRCRLEGVEIDLERDAEGRWRCGPVAAGSDPTSTPTRPVDDAKGNDDPGEAAPEIPDLEIEIAGGSIRLVDAPTGTRLELKALEGNAAWSPGVLDLARLGGRLHGGEIWLVGSVAREGPGLRVEGRLRASDVGLRPGCGAIAFLVPLLGGADGQIPGRLDLDVAFQTQGPDPSTLADRLSGSAQVGVSGVRLDRSPLLQVLAEALPVPPRLDEASLAGSFALARRRAHTDDLVIQLGELPVRLTGWSDFDGRLDYQVRSDHLAERLDALAQRLGPEARAMARDLGLDRQVDRLGSLHLTGTRADLHLTTRRAGQPDRPAASLSRRAVATPTRR